MTDYQRKRRVLMVTWALASPEEKLRVAEQFLRREFPKVTEETYKQAAPAWIEYAEKRGFSHPGIGNWRS